jgi:O-antigen ligase
MREQTRRLNKNHLIEYVMIFLFLLPIFEPKIIKVFPVIDFFFVFGNVVEAAYFIVLLLFTKKRIPKIILFWIGYRVYMLTIMLLNVQLSTLKEWGYLTLLVTNLIFVFEKYRYKNTTLFLSSMSILCTVYLLINFITLLVFKRGIYRSALTSYNPDNDWYFLGIKIQFTTMMIPGITSSLLLMEQEKNKKSVLLLTISILSSLLNIFYKNIGTALFGTILLVLFLFILRISKVRFRFETLLLLALIFNILVLFFNVQNLFSGVLYQLFKKDSTLSTRTLIWESAINLLSISSPFEIVFGHGYNTNFVPFHGITYDYINCHNEFLAILYYNGFVGAILFVSFLLYCCKNRDYRTKQYQLVNILCFVLLLMCINEEYFEIAICYIPFLSFHYFLPNAKNVKINKIVYKNSFLPE